MDITLNMEYNLVCSVIHHVQHVMVVMIIIVYHVILINIDHYHYKIDVYV